MSSLRTLYAFKLRMFLGPIRRQPALAAALVLVALLTLPGALSMGYFLPALATPATPLVDLGALLLSLFLGFGLLISPGGGLLLQPAEVDFVATAPVTVRRFALADALFQTTLFGVGLGFAGVAAIGYAASVGAPAWAFLVPVASFGTLLFLGVLVFQTLGIARLLRRRWAWPVTGLAFAAFVLPGVLRAAGIPISYADLPYPTTAAVQVALLPFGRGDWIGVPVLLAWLLLAVAANALATRTPTLPGLRATFTFSFTPEAKRVQQEALMRLFGKLRITRGARLYRATILRTMAALHRVRMTRDGTLVLGLLFSVVFAFAFIASEGTFPLAGVYIAVFLPTVAVAQWLVSDRTNLWIVAVSGGPPEAFFVGWWSPLAALTAAAGGGLTLFAGVVAGRLDAATTAGTIAAGVAASAGAVVCAARFPYLPNELTVLPLIHILVTGAMAATGLLPVLLLAWLLAPQPVALAAAIVVALVAVAGLSYALVLAATRKPKW